jgi:tripartite-type tricarboxylate transporter receptor subunit TctC
MKEVGYRFRAAVLDCALCAQEHAQAAVDKLAAAAQKAMRDPAVIKRLSDIGTESVGSTPGELDALNRQQFKMYREIVQKNKALLGGK